MRRKEVSSEDLDRALELATEATKEKLQRLRDFSLEEDQLLIEALEPQLKERFPDFQELQLRNEQSSKKKKKKNNRFEGDSEVSSQLQCDFVLKIGQFKVSKGMFSAAEKSQSLARKQDEEITMRAELLLKMNVVFYKLFRHVSHE